MTVAELLKRIEPHSQAAPAPQTTAAVNPPAQEPVQTAIAAVTGGDIMNPTFKTIITDLNLVLGFFLDGKTAEEKAAEIEQLALNTAQDVVAGLLSKYNATAGAIEALVFNAIKGQLEAALSAEIAKLLKAAHLA